MSNILLFQHVPYEGPETILDWAVESGHILTYHHWNYKPAAPEKMPEALVIMGGPMNVDETSNYPWLATEKQFIRQAIETGIPVLGVCLGAQLIAAALGKTVFPNSHQELGWMPLSLTEEARQHPILSAFPDRLPVFHWHGDTFELPDGATLLGSTEACMNQGFAIGKCIGLQFHIEISHTVLKDLIEENQLPDWQGAYVTSPESIFLDATKYEVDCRKTLYQLLDRWAEDLR
ncbi:MAG: type 1 glutamine amidotransferase [Verrucomicrobiota bacterium]